MAATAPIPLHMRIDLGEAFIELTWQRVLELTPSRGGIIEDARYQARRQVEVDAIDAMLDELLPLYGQRALEGVA